MTGSLWASASIIATPTISLYGLLKAGLETELSLKFGIEAGINSDIGTYRKLFLTPGLKFTPVTASLGGWFSKKWDDYAPELEFDPIWERYLHPIVKTSGDLVGPIHVPKSVRYQDGDSYYYVHPNSETVPNFYLDCAYFTKIDGYKYKSVSTAPTLDSWDAILEVYTGESSRGNDWDNVARGDILRHLWEDETWASYSHNADYTLMTIPSGTTKDLEVSGTVGNFANGVTYGLRFNYINKRTGEKLYKEQEPGRGFCVRWPDKLPCGDYYVTEKIDKGEYEKLNYIPIASGISTDANGYWGE